MNRLTGDRRFKPILSLFLAMLFLLPQIVLGATAPDAKKLLTLSGLSTPGLIAADGYGNIFVADTYNNVIKSYNFRGIQTGTIRPSNKVSALAVSPDNLLYAAEVINHSTDGLIEVFKGDGSVVRTIPNDVKLPGAMAFLSTGEMYFISGYSVKKFDAAMNNTSLQFGGNTGAQGSMVAPVSIAIKEVKDPATNQIDSQKSEIYVLDYGFVATSADKTYGATNIVWRVQVFDLNGKYLRSFSNYSYGVDGSVGSASGMALDKQGRVYVSDNVQNIIVVFDGSGLPLMTMSPIVNPVNICFTNDRLYIVSKKSAESSNVGSAEVFGIDSFASLTADPLSLKFVYHNGTAAPSRPISISNTASGSLSWQAAFTSAQGPWLSLSQGSGQVAGNSAQTIDAAINDATASGLAIGTYTGNIKLLSNGGMENIAVRLDVVGSPILTVSPQQFSVSKTASYQINPLNVTVTIANDSTGTLIWQGTPDADWLSITPVTTTSSAENGLAKTVTAAQVVISADPASKVNTTPGIYTGHIAVSAAGAAGSPATITVTLEVTASNTINVTTNTSDASFTITGPGAYSNKGSGQNYTVANLAPGAYTITYAAVKGFKTPVSETQTLVSGEVNFEGEYTDLRKQVNIIASQDAGINSPSQVKVFKADGTQVMLLSPFAAGYGANTASGDVDGDGVADIIAGSASASSAAATASGAGSKAAVLKGFNLAGATISGLSFKYPSNSGVAVSTGDFDGDGKDEVITGSSKASTTVRVFSYNSGQVADTGISFEAYPGNINGVNVATADVDGDGVAELITSPVSSTDVPTVNVYKVDTSGGIGRWTVTLLYRFNACSSVSETKLAVGDVDGDGNPDIITGCMTAGGKAEIREFTAGGDFIRALNTLSSKVDYIAAGDTNMDGITEIILGDAPGKLTQNIKIIDAITGLTINSFRAFTGSSGVGVSVGNLGY